MDELIKVTINKNNEQLVSGRELYEFLEVTTPYKKQFDPMAEYGFAENVDFTVIAKNVHDDTDFGGVRKIIDQVNKI